MTMKIMLGQAARTCMLWVGFLSFREFVSSNERADGHESVVSEPMYGFAIAFRFAESKRMVSSLSLFGPLNEYNALMPQ